MAEEVQQTKKSSKTGYLDSYIQRIVKEDTERFGERSITGKAVTLLNRLSLALIGQITDKAISAVLAQKNRTIGVKNLRQIIYTLFPTESAAFFDREGLDVAKRAEELYASKQSAADSEKHKRIAIELDLKIPPVRISQLVQATAKRMPIVSGGVRVGKKAAAKAKESSKASKKIRVAKFAPYYFASVIESILVQILDSAKDLLEKDVKRITPAEIQMALEKDDTIRQVLDTLGIKVVGAGLYDQFAVNTRELMASQRAKKASGESLTKKEKDKFERERKQIEDVTKKFKGLTKFAMFSQVATITKIVKQIVYSLGADTKRISQWFRLALGLYVEKELFEVAKLAVRTSTIRGRATVGQDDLLFPSAFEGYTGQLATRPREEYVKAGTEALFDKHVAQNRISLRKPQIRSIFLAAGAHRVGAEAIARLTLYADYLFEKYVTGAFRIADVSDEKTIDLEMLLLQLNVAGVTLVYLLRKDTGARVKKVPTIVRRHATKAKSEGGAAGEEAPKKTGTRGRKPGSGAAAKKTAPAAGATGRKRGRPPGSGKAAAGQSKASAAPSKASAGKSKTAAGTKATGGKKTAAKK